MVRCSNSWADVLYMQLDGSVRTIHKKLDLADSVIFFVSWTAKSLSGLLVMNGVERFCIFMQQLMVIILICWQSNPVVV